MDNVTHSLVGILVADCLVPNPKSEKERTLLRWAGVIASNLPDADFLYTGITGGKLGYLVHHRGHTHTLGLLLPLACLTTWLVLGKRRTAPWMRVFLVSLVGLVLHVALDSLNNYGTHPFWPFSSRWIYGDSLFIVEPLLWIDLLPLMLFHPSRWLKRTGALLFVILFGMVLLIPLISSIIKLGLALFSFAWFFLNHRIRRRRIPLTCALGALAIIGLFAFSGRLADREIQKIIPANSEIIKTPLPSNPVCWSAWVRESSVTDYTVHRGQVSILPRLIHVQDCPNRRSGETVASYQAPTIPNSGSVMWTGTYSKPLSDLRQIIDTSCEMKALMEFARLPLWEQTAGGTIIGDLRFDWDHKLSFAKLRIGEISCPRFLPGWLSPMKRVLE